MTATCALCGWRDSADLTDYDGRMVPTCAACVTPPVAPAVSCGVLNAKPRRGQLLGLLQSNGAMTATEVANVLRAEGKAARLAVSQTLWRMAHEGAIEIDRDARPQEYRVKARAA